MKKFHVFCFFLLVYGCYGDERVPGGNVLTAQAAQEYYHAPEISTVEILTPYTVRVGWRDVETASPPEMYRGYVWNLVSAGWHAVGKVDGQARGMLFNTVPFQVFTYRVCAVYAFFEACSEPHETASHDLRPEVPPEQVSRPLYLPETRANAPFVCLPQGNETANGMCDSTLGSVADMSELAVTDDATTREISSRCKPVESNAVERRVLVWSSNYPGSKFSIEQIGDCGQNILCPANRLSVTSDCYSGRWVTLSSDARIVRINGVARGDTVQIAVITFDPHDPKIKIRRNFPQARSFPVGRDLLDNTIVLD